MTDFQISGATNEDQLRMSAIMLRRAIDYGYPSFHAWLIENPLKAMKFFDLAAELYLGSIDTI